MRKDIIAILLVLFFVLMEGTIVYILATAPAPAQQERPAILTGATPTPTPSFVADYKDWSRPQGETDIVTQTREYIIRDAEIVSHQWIPEGWSYSGTYYEGKITGVVKNTGNVDEDIFIRAKFYDDKGNVIDYGIDSVSDLSPGETWQYEIPYFEKAVPAKYQVYISGIY